MSRQCLLGSKPFPRAPHSSAALTLLCGSDFGGLSWFISSVFFVSLKGSQGTSIETSQKAGEWIYEYEKLRGEK